MNKNKNYTPITVEESRIIMKTLLAGLIINSLVVLLVGISLYTSITMTHKVDYLVSVQQSQDVTDIKMMSDWIKTNPTNYAQGALDGALQSCERVNQEELGLKDECDYLKTVGKE